MMHGHMNLKLGHYLSHASCYGTYLHLLMIYRSITGAEYLNASPFIYRTYAKSTEPIRVKAVDISSVFHKLPPSSSLLIIFMFWGMLRV